MLAFIIGARVLGAFAPRKTAAFPAPGLRRLVASFGVSRRGWRRAGYQSEALFGGIDQPSIAGWLCNEDAVHRVLPNESEEVSHFLVLAAELAVLPKLTREGGPLSTTRSRRPGKRTRLQLRNPPEAVKR